MRRIAIVGGGLAGLAAAYYAAKTPDVSVTLFEATDRLGGTIETSEVAGFTVEGGPDSWVSDRPAARELAQELGLGGEILYSNDHLRRTYIVQGRELVPMPDGMRMMVPTRWRPVMESPLFSWQARLAYLREPKRAEELKAFAAAKPLDFDETVRAFVTRHFGEEATETIAGPLLAGVFGGDIATLSAGAVLAPFVKQEREQGSLIAAAMAASHDSQTRSLQPIFTTLRSGLGTLVERLAAALPAGSVVRNARVGRIGKTATGWSVATEPTPAMPLTIEHFDALLLATPAHVTRALLAPVHAAASELLAMETTSAITVALLYGPKRATAMRVPRGFGFLVPPKNSRGDAPELLAGTFMHQKFPYRAPEGGVFLRGFFGGAHAPGMLHWDDARIAETARERFARLLGALPVPTEVVVRRWPQSLPQYAVGHPQRMVQLAKHLETLPGLGLTGNAYYGVGLPALVQHARETVGSLLAERAC